MAENKYVCMKQLARVLVELQEIAADSESLLGQATLQETCDSMASWLRKLRVAVEEQSRCVPCCAHIGLPWEKDIGCLCTCHKEISCTDEVLAFRPTPTVVHWVGWPTPACRNTDPERYTTAVPSHVTCPACQTCLLTAEER